MKRKMKRGEYAEAILRDLDPGHIHAKLRSVVARCENYGPPALNLRHDIWKAMSALREADLAMQRMNRKLDGSEHGVVEME
jgi:hypothetical protein